jgi:hypothetical protein
MPETSRECVVCLLDESSFTVPVLVRRRGWKGGFWVGSLSDLTESGLPGWGLAKSSCFSVVVREHHFFRDY